MKQRLENMTLEEKIGQLLMFGIEGTEVNEETMQMVEKYKAGNVILFTHNIKGIKQLFKLTQDLHQLSLKHLGLPMFIGIDQEGGMVTRIQSEATFFPGAMTIAANHLPLMGYEVGKQMGFELKQLGININFAPVLDVNNNPKNPVIGVRSYSDNPEEVAKYGLPFIQGLQEHVIATAKHFPGHGDTVVDSHVGLPTVNHSRERLEAVEFAPFKKAINAGIHGMMSSHIYFPALTEGGKPATLSHEVMTTLLRDEFGFEGLIVTDGMEMKAIADRYGTVEASLMAVQAGVNIYCVCHSPKLALESMERIKEAVLNGEISEDVINERVERVLHYKEKYAHTNVDFEFADVESLIGTEEAKDMSYQIVKGAATLVKGKPLQLKNKALLIGTLPKATTIADDRLGNHDIFQELNHDFPELTVLKIPVIPSEEDVEMALDKAQAYDQIIITTYNANVYRNQVQLLEKLHTLGKEVHVIAMRNPYDLVDVPVIQNYVCLYEYTPNSVRVLKEYLKGNLQLKGKVPIQNG
ncbi:MAG: beta-N-acetylhexosaminidase [Acholeplasmataceae bacterium]